MPLPPNPVTAFLGLARVTDAALAARASRNAAYAVAADRVRSRAWAEALAELDSVPAGSAAGTA